MPEFGLGIKGERVYDIPGISNVVGVLTGESSPPSKVTMANAVQFLKEGIYEAPKIQGVFGKNLNCEIRGHDFVIQKDPSAFLNEEKINDLKVIFTDGVNLNFLGNKKIKNKLLRNVLFIGSEPVGEHFFRPEIKDGRIINYEEMWNKIQNVID